MNRNLCKCVDPQPYADRIDHIVKCSTCELTARLELGKHRDDFSRIRYRASVNRELEKAAAIERQMASGRKADKLDARRYRAARIRQMHEDGLSYRQIAEALNVSTTTVKYWVNSNYRRSKRESARRWAAQNPEKRKASQDATNEKRRDQQRAYSRTWTRQNPSRKRLNNLAYERREAA